MPRRSLQPEVISFDAAISACENTGIKKVGGLLATHQKRTTAIRIHSRHVNKSKMTGIILVWGLRGASTLVATSEPSRADEQGWGHCRCRSCATNLEKKGKKNGNQSSGGSPGNPPKVYNSSQKSLTSRKHIQKHGSRFSVGSTFVV